MLFGEYEQIPLRILQAYKLGVRRRAIPYRPYYRPRRRRGVWRSRLRTMPTRYRAQLMLPREKKCRIVCRRICS